jgi:energy-coupling factor transporter ATP-binding protein EcfA2
MQLRVTHFCVTHIRVTLFCVTRICMTQNSVTPLCVISSSVMRIPFEFGRELGITELVDREAEVDSVIETIRDGRKLFLIGPRRYGKTSILKAAQDRLAETDAVVLRFDAESYPSLDMLVAAIVAESAKQLKSGVERAGEQIGGFFSRLRPQLDFNLNEGSWTAKLGVDRRDDSTGISLLVEALDGIEALARAQPEDRAVGLVIDEFQKIVELGGASAEGQIRAAIQRHKRTGYVFAGSKMKIMTAMTTDASRPFYRLGSIRFIGAIPRADFEAFLTRKFTEGRFRVEDPEAVEAIMKTAEEVPYNVQMLAGACWETLRDRSGGKAPELTTAVVTESLHRLVRQQDPFYTQLWSGLTSIQQKTLLAVIAEEGVGLQSMKVARATGAGPSTIRRSLDALVNKGVLRDEAIGGSVKMRFEDPFFGRWVSLFAAGFPR